MRARQLRSGQTGGAAGLPIRTAYAALAWVIVFFAFHVYWYAGGAFGRAGALPALVPDSVGGWIFEVLVVSAFPLGAAVCLAIARGWPRGSMRRAAAVVVWLGCALLALRGGSGLVDDLTRAAGLLPNGITGLSLEETMGTAHPSASELWSSYATDAYFAVGGLIFGLLACRYRTRRVTRACARGHIAGVDRSREFRSGKGRLVNAGPRAGSRTEPEWDRGRRAGPAGAGR